VEVAKALIDYHTLGTQLKLHDLRPHLWVNGEGERFEIDLLITLKGKQTYNGTPWQNTRKIAVEFKEADIRRVISQAVTRRPYVDYVYIATRKWVDLDFRDLLVMGYYGLGWVVWDRDFAKIITPSKYRLPASSLDLMIEVAVKRHLQKAIEKVEKHVNEKRITDFIGGMNADT